jgi:hypothetical protein
VDHHQREAAEPRFGCAQIDNPKSEETNVNHGSLCGTCSLLICLAAPLLPATGICETTEVVASAVHKGEKFEPLRNDEKSGRLVFFSQSRANDRETRGKGLFDGTNRTTTAYWDMTNGLGAGNGFSRQENGGDSVVIQWTGVCYPIAGSDGKAVPHCSGGWYAVPGTGTGRYASVKSAGGTWTGRMMPDGNFHEEWRGLIEQ